MFVKIRTLAGVTFNVLIPGKATILDLKKKLPTPASYLKNISLVYKGVELPNFMSFQQLGFTDSDFLVVVFNKKRHREAQDKEGPKISARKQLKTTSTLSAEELALRNMRRRKRVRVRVGTISVPNSTSTTTPSPTPTSSLSDFPWARTFDSTSSGSESSDQETPSTSRLRYSSEALPSIEDDLVEFDGNEGDSVWAQTETQLRLARFVAKESSSSTSDLPTSISPDLPNIESSSLSESLARAQNERKSATRAILERMHRRRSSSLSGTPVSLETKVVKVDEEKLGQLTTMGFRKPAATRALLLHRNNLEASVAWLLENSSSTRINEPISSEEISVLSNAVASLQGHGTSLTTATSSLGSIEAARNTRTRAARASFSDFLGLNQLDNFKFFEILPQSPGQVQSSPHPLPSVGGDNPGHVIDSL